ncbi:MAG: hypothetical protein ABEJ89_06455 [Haloarculaceae archaeon]
MNWLPTRRDDWRLVGQTVVRVLSRPGYAAVAVVSGVLALTLFTALNNLGLVGYALSSDLAPGLKAELLLNLYPFVSPAYTFTTSVTIALVSVVAGINGALGVYHFREHRVRVRDSGGSVVGVLIATVGAGCPACGTAIVAGLLSTFGASGLLSVLPFEGAGISALAVAVLLLSTYWLADGMRGGDVEGCPVPRRGAS